MMKRCLSLCLAFALIAVLAVPVSAAESNPGGWIELLEYSSVGGSGENWFMMNGTSGSFTIPLETEKRLNKIDILIWHQTAEVPTSASVTNGSTSKNLTVLNVGTGLTRIYGDIPNAYYESVTVTINKSSTLTAVFEVLSCEVTPFRIAEYACDAVVWRNGNPSDVMQCPGNYEYDGDGSAGVSNVAVQIPILVNDWEKYDIITVYGSLSYIGLNSVRCSIGNMGLPYEISYTNTNSSGEISHTTVWLDVGATPNTPNYPYYVAGDENTVSGATYNGKVLFTITIDVSAIDRTLGSNPLVVYFTGVQNLSYGHAFNVQGVSGSIVTPDTTQVSIWNRFTSFMTDLFGAKDTGALDDLGSSSDSISQNTSQIHDFEQSQQAVLDNNFAAIQGALTFTHFAAALVFVQKYANMTFNGISQYAIIFTLPLFLGLFFYLCSRIPGITRWKTPPPRSPSPKSKGGGKP